MSVWRCPLEVHDLKVNKKATPNLQWVRSGFRPDGSVNWLAKCRACDKLACPECESGDDIVSFPTPSGKWLPACLWCLSRGFHGDAARWTPEDAEESERAA